MRRYAGLFSLFLLGLLAALFLLRPDPPVPATEPDIKPAAEGIAPGNAKTSGFDFYVLSLSWSPTFCRSGDAAGNPQQCGGGGRYGLVVHGLWPQNESGYPQSCPTFGEDRVPESLGSALSDIMPGMGLIGHQWRKHGSCSGLDQADYFALLRKAYERITVPAEFSQRRPAQSFSPARIESLFAAANPGLGTDGMAVTCDGDFFDEIRICLTTDLNFRKCREVDRQSCRRPHLTAPPMR